MAQRPYPAELATDIEHRGEILHLRPVRPEDKDLIVSEVNKRMTVEDLRMRFFSPIQGISPQLAERLYNIDYDRVMALLLLKGDEMQGLVRLAIEEDGQEAEFAVTVASDRQRRGYGLLMMQHILAYARSRGVKLVYGHVLRENAGMLALVERLGLVRSPRVSMSSDLRVEKRIEAL